MDDNAWRRAAKAVGYTNVYIWSDGDWQQKGQSIAGGSDNARSGFSVAISNDCSRVITGAPYDDTHGQNAGSVTVHDYSDDTSEWVQESKIGGSAHDLFGTSVAISADGTRLAVGAVGSAPIGNPNMRDSDGAQSRFVKMFDWTGAGWAQLGSTTTGSGQYDQFGYNIVLSPKGDRLLVSSLLRDGRNTPDSGSVRLISLTPVSPSYHRQSRYEGCLLLQLLTLAFFPSG